MVIYALQISGYADQKHSKKKIRMSKDPAG
jgi:hypothetical protein